MARVLMIGGDPCACQAVSRTLAGLGYGVDVACDCSTGLALAERKRYTHVVVDHDIDHCGGIKLYEQLRSLQQGAVGILLTAAANLNTVVAAIEAGMRRVLPKPIDYQQLIQLLAQTKARIGNMRASRGLSETEIARLSQFDIRERLTINELVGIIRSVEYPFAGKERLEHFDRDTLERVVHLVCRWCRQRLAESPQPMM